MRSLLIVVLVGKLLEQVRQQRKVGDEASQRDSYLEKHCLDACVNIIRQSLRNVSIPKGRRIFWEDLGAQSQAMKYKMQKSSISVDNWSVLS